MDLGDPISYLVLAKGTPVLCSDGHELGRVEHVLADADADVFDGVIVAVGGGGHRFVDASEVADLHERGVVLAIDEAAAGRLPEPRANPAAMDTGPDDTTPTGLDDKLRRAWDYLSGNY
jgi:PRC-barrel domain